MLCYDCGSSVGVPVENRHGEDGLPSHLIVSQCFLVSISNSWVIVLYRDECCREEEHCQERNTFHSRAVSLARGSDTFRIFGDFGTQLAFALASETVNLRI